MNCDAKMHIKNKTDVNWSKNSFYCLPYLSQIGKSNTNKVQCKRKFFKRDDGVGVGPRRTVGDYDSRQSGVLLKEGADGSGWV